ncbi:MAG: hypothetical protein MJE77_28645 [Proteobacteria bacterium]|nr:hypothetical protein [Pseudomonadota bacterium]
MRQINLEVTVEEANLILEGLGQLAFVKVYALISKIQDQAREQLNGEAVPGERSQADPPSPTVAEKSHVK